MADPAPDPASPTGRYDATAGVLLGLFFGAAVLARHRLADDWGSVARWLPIVPTLAVAAWEHRLAARRPPARRLVWAGLAATILSIVAGAALLRSQDPSPAVDALVVAVVALPLVVVGLLLRGD